MATASRQSTRNNGTGLPLPVVMGEYAGLAAELLKALANRHRLLILCVLGEGELSVGELNARIALSQSALSQHLAVLRKDALVETRRESQTIYYRIAPGPAADVIRVLHEHYCRAPGRTPGRLTRGEKHTVRTGERRRVR